MTVCTKLVVSLNIRTASLKTSKMQQIAWENNRYLQNTCFYLWFEEAFDPHSLCFPFFFLSFSLNWFYLIKCQQIRALQDKIRLEQKMRIRNKRHQLCKEPCSGLLSEFLKQNQEVLKRVLAVNLYCVKRNILLIWSGKTHTSGSNRIEMLPQTPCKTFLDPVAENEPFFL